MNLKAEIRRAFIIVLTVILFWVINTRLDDAYAPYVTIGLFLLIVAFVVAQRKYWFKHFALSKWNFIADKYSETHLIDMEKELLFDKLVEVLPQANFKLRYTDREKGQLFATAGMTLWSFGENIYVDLTAQGEQTQLDFHSTNIIQAVSWGKNKSNFQVFFHSFEKSLTI